MADSFNINFFFLCLLAEQSICSSAIYIPITYNTSPQSTRSYQSSTRYSRALTLKGFCPLWPQVLLPTPAMDLARGWPCDGDRTFNVIRYACTSWRGARVFQAAFGVHIVRNLGEVRMFMSGYGCMRMDNGRWWPRRDIWYTWCWFLFLISEVASLKLAPVWWYRRIQSFVSVEPLGFCGVTVVIYHTDCTGWCWFPKHN